MNKIYYETVWGFKILNPLVKIIDYIRYAFIPEPQLCIPVHGEPRHMEANAKVAQRCGVPLTLTGRNGDLFYLSPAPGVRRRWATVGRLQVDETAKKLERAPS